MKMCMEHGTVEMENLRCNTPFRDLGVGDQFYPTPFGNSAYRKVDDTRGEMITVPPNMSADDPARFIYLQSESLVARA